MIKIDLNRVRDFDLREVLRQVSDALNRLDNKVGTGSKQISQTAQTIIQTSSGGTSVGCGRNEYVVDQTILDRNWVIIDHLPKVLSETVYVNGLAILAGNDNGVPSEYNIVGNVVTFNYELHLGDVLKITYLH